MVEEKKGLCVECKKIKLLVSYVWTCRECLEKLKKNVKSDVIDLKYIDSIEIIDETGRVFCDTKINKIDTELKGTKKLILKISHTPEVKTTIGKNKFKNFMDIKNVSRKRLDRI